MTKISPEAGKKNRTSCGIAVWRVKNPANRRFEKQKFANPGLGINGF